MPPSPYDAIANWYDAYLRKNPLYAEVILPGMLALAGDVGGQVICDLACGQGFITRELARRGAQVTGADLSENMLALAQGYEASEPLGIRYLLTDAQDGAALSSAAFDGVTCGMALMPIPDLRATLQTVRRIMRPGGWFVCSITHPCYQTPHSRWVTREDGAPAREVSGYFDEGYWTSTNSSGVRGLVGEYHRTLATYLNTLVEVRLSLERLGEPQATGRSAEAIPGAREAPSILLIRARAV
ncbi:MAG TPA: class I SAM-dependent methyltransferase [Ktedonobacterales bacterium]|jgi:SAM-dependent methyltransferase|nr:class I SAM-dependent methyltransferase [Ktedonobacterales bacterium]